MKKIYFLVTVFLVSLLYGQENPLSLKNLHQVNTYNGGQLLHSAFDKNGNTVIAGFANGDFKIDGQSIPTVNTNDIFIYKSKADSFEKKWLNVFKTTLTSL